MTIINNTTYLQNYPYLAIQGDVLGLFRRCFRETAKIPIASPEVLLSLFDCYCHITGRKVNYISLSSPKFLEIVLGFVGSMASKSFVANKTESRHIFCRWFISILSHASKEIPALVAVPEWSPSLLQKYAHIWHDQLKVVLERDIRYWHGWPVETRKGQVAYLALATLWLSHGTVFAEEYYGGLKGLFSKQARPSPTESNALALFLSENAKDWPVECFYNPLKISDLIKTFFKWHFLNSHQKGLNLNAQIKAWNRFLSNIDEVFIQPGIWAKPFGDGFPSPSATAVPGATTRVKRNKDGVIVKDKLITEVPLQVTDDQAIKILFKQINKDLKVVADWAKSQSFDLRRRQLSRVSRSVRGSAIEFGIPGNRGLHEMNHDDLCATFERCGFITGSRKIHRMFGHRVKANELADLLGLPVRGSLFPFMCLLVIEHPIITSAFLTEFELYNKRGQLAGFIKSDGYYQLVGYKDRRKKSLSEQRIALTPRAAAIIRQVVQITAPLRDYLKKSGDDKWRRLFLTCGQGFSHPKAGLLPPLNISKFASTPSIEDIYVCQFKRYSDLSGKSLLDFIVRVSLSSVRASRGVQIYLETKSVKEMAEALGHAKYDSNLLSHYLPEPILAFFQTRWIRIFQKAFICEAMKGSPYLLEATHFDSMRELHEFLENHALKDIPTHLSNPDNKPNAMPIITDDSHIFISVNAGILSTLISLEQAVNNSKDKNKVCGYALYWSDVSRLVTKEIANGSDMVLKQHLSEAILHIHPEKMEKIIYDSAR